MIQLHGFFMQLLLGAKLTLIVAIGALILGLLLGLIGAISSLSKHRSISMTAIAITSVIRGLPELIVLFIVYFGGTVLLTKIFHHYVEVSALSAGIVALALIFAAYATETLRGAFLAITAGQAQAANALGLTKTVTFFHITLPQAWQHALPGLSNLWLVLLKDTALVSLIGLADLMNKAQLAASETSKPFTFYLAAGIIYLTLTSISYVATGYLTKNSNKHEITA